MTLQTQAQTLRKAFTTQYQYHPKAVMEHEFDNEGEHSMEKKSKSNNFVARLRTITPNLDVMYEEQYKVFNAFQDLEVLVKMGSNVVAFNNLAKVYGKLSVALKSFNKAYKEQSKVPEVKDYYEAAKDLLSVDVYKMMKEDLAMLQPVFSERMQEHKNRFPDFSNWDSDLIDWEQVNLNFKQSK